MVGKTMEIKIAKEKVPFKVRFNRFLDKIPTLDDWFFTVMAKQNAESWGKRKAGGVSLNGYLHTASVCYREAFEHSVSHMTELQMYRVFSDGRFGNMLEIKKKDSAKAFAKWISSEDNVGNHPFEIVRGMGTFGIHLIPPSTERPFFTLTLGSEIWSDNYLKMARALAKSGIPSEAPDLERAVSYLEKKA
ncbi:MAG: hypothetical protein NTV88_05665 [Candidatus Micrarchaeota archaeon]|nr:hypothetical protein [Candidatus Micrarchaeota archaeon]